jgi:2,4-dienoyl-CoA reductase (NADPH2)
MECAYVAAQRGHEVHIYDKRSEVGGTILEASRAPYGDEELMTCVNYQKTMCEKAGVTFHLGEEVTEQRIADEMPDSVVLATGPIYPQIKGAAGRDNVVNVLDVLSGKAQVGDTVVVYGNRKPGIGVALSLAKQGKKVTIVGREKSAGFDVNPSFKWRYMIYLKQNGVMAYNDCDIEAINDGEIMVKTYDGYRFPVACDTVVVSEREANEALKKTVQAEGIELFVIGDALVPRNMSSAVHDGYRIGLRI